MDPHGDYFREVMLWLRIRELRPRIYTSPGEAASHPVYCIWGGGGVLTKPHKVTHSQTSYTAMSDDRSKYKMGHSSQLC